MTKAASGSSAAINGSEKSSLGEKALIGLLKLFAKPLLKAIQTIIAEQGKSDRAPARDSDLASSFMEAFKSALSEEKDSSEKGSESADIDRAVAVSASGETPDVEEEPAIESTGESPALDEQQKQLAEVLNLFVELLKQVVGQEKGVEKTAEKGAMKSNAPIQQTETATEVTKQVDSTAKFTPATPAVSTTASADTEKKAEAQRRFGVVNASRMKDIIQTVRNGQVGSMETLAAALRGEEQKSGKVFSAASKPAYQFGDAAEAYDPYAVKEGSGPTEAQIKEQQEVDKRRAMEARQKRADSFDKLLGKYESSPTPELAGELRAATEAKMEIEHDKAKAAEVAAEKAAADKKAAQVTVAATGETVETVDIEEREAGTGGSKGEKPRTFSEYKDHFREAGSSQEMTTGKAGGYEVPVEVEQAASKASQDASKTEAVAKEAAKSGMFKKLMSSIGGISTSGSDKKKPPHQASTDALQQNNDDISRV